MDIQSLRTRQRPRPAEGNNEARQFIPDGKFPAPWPTGPAAGARHERTANQSPGRNYPVTRPGQNLGPVMQTHEPKGLPRVWEFRFLLRNLLVRPVASVIPGIDPISVWAHILQRLSWSHVAPVNDMTLSSMDSSSEDCVFSKQSIWDRCHSTLGRAMREKNVEFVIWDSLPLRE